MELVVCDTVEEDVRLGFPEDDVLTELEGEPDTVEVGE